MKILIDNNIMLDALLERKPFNEAAERILTACADEHAGCLSANSLTDIFFILRKSMSVSEAKSVIKKLTELFEVISVNEEDCLNALALPIDDFEDALVDVCARKVGADFIVSRDDKFISEKTGVKVITPKQLIEKLK